MATTRADEQFVTLLTGHQSRLAGFIFALVPSNEAAQDILQETNLVLWRKADEFKSGTRDAFWAWASQVARYQVMAYKRDVLRDRHVLSEGFMQRVAKIAERVSADADRRSEALRSCIQKLPDDKRQIVEDRYIAAESVAEISTKTGKTRAAVGKLLFRVRKTLLDCVLRELRKGQQV